ncbi:MAG: M24 family metallopeptidase [Clostridiales bacterium]|jgi:Xaa-Pro aminopeptidase|nr:M24 family metallopeptidase [Clostridiales bacterium]
MSTLIEEFKIKIAKLRLLADAKNAGGILITDQGNFSWLTCGGRGFIGLASELSCAPLLISPAKVYLIANNIERPRLLDEEVPEISRAIETTGFPWQELGKNNAAFINNALDGRPCLADTLIMDDIIKLRSVLQESEMDRYACLCRESAAVLEDICTGLKPGVTEFEAAGRLSSMLWKKGIEPITLLIAFDERIIRYRHPLPTAARLQKTAMLAMCARRHGLIASASRMVSLGSLSDELRQRHNAVAEIDAQLISDTSPGVTLRDVFLRALESYRKAGYPEEWKLHHQGGLTGYGARDYVANEENTFLIHNNQAYAWNPTITGTKSEDTILITGGSARILTHTGTFPYKNIKVSGGIIRRPDILTL